MIAVEYAFATPEALGGVANYRRWCRRAELEALPGGYGLILCIDDEGRRWTAFDEPELLELMVAGAERGALGSLQLPEERFALRREGWPDDW